MVVFATASSRAVMPDMGQNHQNDGGGGCKAVVGWEKAENRETR